MTRIRIRETSEVLSETSFRILHKKTRPVLPNVLTEEILDSFGADPVFEGPQPTLTPPYEISVYDGVKQDETGKWFVVYNIGPTFNEYADENGYIYTVEEQMNSYKAIIDESISSDVRNTRNQYLSKTDWTQIPDSPLSEDQRTAWANYRKSLRDLTDHENFPHLSNSDWPTQPTF